MRRPLLTARLASCAERPSAPSPRSPQAQGVRRSAPERSLASSIPPGQRRQLGMAGRDRRSPTADSVGVAVRSSGRARTTLTSERARAVSATASSTMAASAIALRQIHCGGVTRTAGILRVAKVAANTAAPAAMTAATASASDRSSAMKPTRRPNVAPTITDRDCESTYARWQTGNEVDSRVSMGLTHSPQSHAMIVTDACRSTSDGRRDPARGP